MVTDSTPNKLAELTAEQLALRSQQGSKACFTELVNRFGPRLYRYFHLRINSREDSEDLVQDTLVKAFRNIHRYRGQGSPGRSNGILARGKDSIAGNQDSFATWIFTIGTRRLIDHLRTRERQRNLRPPSETAAAENPYDSAARRDEFGSLWEVARTLPKKQYDTLWLRYMEGMSVREIARTLGLTRVHVKVLLFRARTRLAQLHTQRTDCRPARAREQAVLKRVSL